MLVSVVIPAYNSIYVRDAIVSILNQTHQDLDVIVVDDGSPGGAIQSICAEFPGVRYVRQANAGPSAGRNRGIHEAKGDWIAFLDDDDTWLPHKLEKQIRLIQESSSSNRIGLIYTGQYMLQEETVLGGKIDQADGMVYSYLLFGNFIGTCSSVMIPKHVFEKVGGFDETLICSQDFDLYLRIAREYEIRSVNEPLIYYRTRPDQISKDPRLNHADDEVILRRQKEYVEPALFRMVLEFHRKVASRRYKDTAYDALFRQKDRNAYWKWLWRSGWIGRRPPSVQSLAYLGLTLTPGWMIDLVARIKSCRPSGPATGTVGAQNVMEDFVWMGIRRGSLPETPGALLK